MQEISLIKTLAFGLAAALVLGLGAKRVGLSPIVGYLIAGMVVGPHTPGFVGDLSLAKQLAEVGVILLMFGVGLQFHFADLVAVRGIAIPGALGQGVIATACGWGVAMASGWSQSSGVMLGLAVAVASTVVLLRVLMDAELMESAEGRVAIGWLVVQDILTVLVLVLLPAFALPNAAGGIEIARMVGLALLKLVALAAAMAVVGVRFVPWLLLRVASLKSRELFTLTVLVIAMTVATIGYITSGASMALGAFLAGMVVAQSKLSHQAAADALPMRDAFAVLFFVSVGMLFDWRQVMREPGLLVGLLVVVLLVTPTAALLIVLACGRSLRTALTVAGGLAQIGEFSFILAEAAARLGLMPESGDDALVGCAIVSISVNPWLFKRVLGLEAWIKRRPRLYRVLNRRVDKLVEETNQAEARRVASSSRGLVIIVGYGPVGRTVARRTEEFGLMPVVIDINIDTVLTLQAEGKRALYGDASRAGILREAGLPKASYLVVSLPDVGTSVAVIHGARELNPAITILARTRYIANGGALEQAGADAVCYDEAEAATALGVVLRAHLKARAGAAG